MRFCCPRCKQIIEADDSSVGQTAACPHCEWILIIPAVISESNCCPECGNRLSGPYPVICVNCGYRFRKLPETSGGEGIFGPQSNGRLWLIALGWFVSGVLCIAVTLTPLISYLEQALTFLPIRSVRATLWLGAFACFAMTYRVMPVRTITRHYLDWMGFCGKYGAILAAIAGAVIGSRIKSGRPLPDNSTLVSQSHAVECIILGIAGAAAGLFIGAVIGIILGIVVARFTHSGCSED